MGLLDFTPYDTSGGVLPIANNRVSSAFGQFPNWQDEPMSMWDLARLQAQPQQPQQTQPASLPMQQPQQEQPQQQQPMQQPMAQPQSPGFGDRLNAGLMGFANGGAPIPALANLISGLATGQRSDPAGVQQQNQAATYQAIRAAGGNHAQALAGATNPAFLKDIAPGLFDTTPKLQKIGTDILGRDVMGEVKSVGGKLYVNGKPAGEGGGNATGGNALPTGIDENKPIYDQLPKAQQNIVDQMLSGRKAPPAAFALKTQYWQTLQAAASQKAAENGGMFDETTWGQRFKAAQDLAPQGRSGKTINALDTVQGHIGDKLLPAIDKLEKSGIAPNLPIANWLQNMGAGIAPALMKERTQALTSFNNARKAVVDEMGNAYKAGHLTDAEVRDWSALINNADSIIKLRQATADFVDLLNTKRQATINQYKGLDVPFKGANDEENARVTKLVHDRNAGDTSAAPSATSAPPPGAVKALRKDPTLLPQFEAKYGPGSAQRVLNGAP